MKLKDLIGANPPLVLDNGTQVCLSYHIHRSCWSTCRRANTHGHQLTAPEKVWVQQYLQTQLQKLSTQPQRAASGAPSANMQS